MAVFHKYTFFGLRVHRVVRLVVFPGSQNRVGDGFSVHDPSRNGPNTILGDGEILHVHPFDGLVKTKTPQETRNPAQEVQDGKRRK